MLSLRRLTALVLFAATAPITLLGCGGGGGSGSEIPPAEQIDAVYTGSAYGYQAGASSPFLRFDFTQTTYSTGRSQTELSICNLTPITWCFSYSGVMRVNFVQWGYAGSVTGLAGSACSYRGVVSTNPARIDLGVTTFTLSGIGGCVHAFAAEEDGPPELIAPAFEGRSLRVRRIGSGAAWTAELRAADGSPDRVFAPAAIEAEPGDRELAALMDDRGALLALHRAATAEIELVQLGPAGQLDADFGAEGRVRSPGMPTGLALARDAVGRILVAWTDSDGARIVLERRFPGGALDEAIGGTGRVELDFGVANLEVEALDVDARGRLLLVARLRGSEHVLIGRLDPNGATDPAFGDLGVAHFSLARSEDVSARVSLRESANGGITVAARVEAVLLDARGAEVVRLASVEPIEGQSPGFESGRRDRRSAWGAARAK